MSAQLLAERAASQLLTGPPARTPEQVAERLLAVQAQDPRGARLAVRVRSTGLRAADVDAALTAHRSLVIATLVRGTLHLVLAEDLPWLHALTTPPLATGNARRLAEEGVPPDDAERGVAALVRALEDGPLLRAALREHVARAGVRAEGQALPHLLMLAGLRGLVVRGPVVPRASGMPGEQAWVLWRDWLGPPPPSLERAAALGRLAARYLAGHAPATDRDLARWSGLPLRDARAGLREAGAVERPDGRAVLPGADRSADLPTATPPALPPPRLMGPFDPVLLGWASRADVVGEHGRLVTSNGIFRAFLMVGGRAVGTWGLSAGRLELEPLEPVAGPDLEALERDAGLVREFLQQP